MCIQVQGSVTQNIERWLDEISYGLSIVRAAVKESVCEDFH